MVGKCDYAFSHNKQNKYASENISHDVESLSGSCGVGFGRLLNLFRTLQLRDNLKVDWTAAKKQYIVAILLTNLSNCCSPAQVSQYYDCDPPTLTEYLAEITENSSEKHENN